MSSTIVDLLGVGFGPASLSVAVAMSENGLASSCAFVEAYDRFKWHPGMMVSLIPDYELTSQVGGAKMQISFVKDLATMRNPASTYSFLRCVPSPRSR